MSVTECSECGARFHIGAEEIKSSLLYLKQAERITELESRLKEAESVIGFYANNENWEVVAQDDLCTVKTKLTKDKESFGEVERAGSPSKLVIYGGKLARQYMEKVK